MSSNQLPPDTHLAYVVTHEAWYANSLPDRRPEINVMASAEGGGVAWEFTVEEIDLGSSGPAIRVKVFYDAFAAFTQIPEFFAALADGEKDLHGVRVVLDGLGAVDETERRNGKYGEIPAKATANRVRKAIADAASPEDATAAVMRLLGMQD